VLAVLAGCKAPPATRHDVDSSVMARGKRLIEATGCGACHEIPGIDWPRGRLGPSLMDYDDVGLVGGARPANLGTLAAFIRNPRSVRPDSTMPAMPLSEAQAADVAAYLYGQADD